MKCFLSLLAIGLISTNVGCTLCSSCDDYSYGAFGGLWERSDLTYGRVGSAFAPNGFAISEGPQVSEGATQESSEDSEGATQELLGPESSDPDFPRADDASERSLLEI